MPPASRSGQPLSYVIRINPNSRLAAYSGSPGHGPPFRGHTLRRRWARCSTVQPKGCHYADWPVAGVRDRRYLQRDQQSYRSLQARTYAVRHAARLHNCRRCSCNCLAEGAHDARALAAAPGCNTRRVDEPLRAPAVRQFARRARRPRLRQRKLSGPDVIRIQCGNVRTRRTIGRMAASVANLRLDSTWIRRSSPVEKSGDLGFKRPSQTAGRGASSRRASKGVHAARISAAAPHEPNLPARQRHASAFVTAEDVGRE